MAKLKPKHSHCSCSQKTEHRAEEEWLYSAKRLSNTTLLEKICSTSNVRITEWHMFTIMQSMQNTETGFKVDISLCSQLVFSGNVTDRANVTGM